MSAYKIIGFENNHVILELDRPLAFQLPIIDGKYPEGAALDAYLKPYVDNYIASQAPPVEASNAAAIRALITAPTPPVVPPVTAAQARAKRDVLLRESDWTQLSDAGLTAPQLAQWVVYRQELRNVPLQPGFPASVVWPTEPT